ncbi:response regulator [Azonexus sp. R2A61]|uniref:response regulator n=1 Tax=Azonexus sp. R2A61 TaxID=2744443 RepID=UPI001F459D0D|nr:response regulator [Azonexus sp. R2A61]
MAGIPFRRPSFANSLVLRIGLLILLSLAAFSVGFVQLLGLPTVQRLAESQLKLAAEQVESRYGRLLDSVEITLRSSQSWARNGQLDQGQLLRFNDLFFPILANNREINSVIFAHESGREIFLLLGANGGWVNRISNPAEWGRQTYWIYWTPDRRIDRVEMQERDYDARQRPWFTGAIALERDEQIHWTQPYVFFTSGQPGITASMRWQAADGSKYVIAHDVRLSDMASFTSQLALGEQGQAALLLDDGRVIAPPRDARFADPEAMRKALLKTPEALALPELGAALQRWRDDPAPVGGMHLHDRPDGIWFSLFRHIEPQRSNLWVGVTAPRAEYIPIRGGDLGLLGLILLLALGLGTAVAVRIARRFGRPLAALGEESQRIGRLELDAPVIVDAPWHEVARLAEAIEAMRQQLQFSQQALQNINADLEQTVALRTRALRQSQEDLQKREGLLRALLDTLPNPIFYKGADTRFLGCNRAYEEFFGIDRNAFVGKRVLDLDYLPLDERQAYQAEDERIIGEAGCIVREMLMPNADGSLRDTLYSVNGFLAPDGTPGGLIGVIVDITPQKNAERDAGRARAAAEAAAAAKSDFLANMSHEIRTPMNAIIGMNHLALQTELTAKQRNYLNKVDVAAKGLLGIINDILDLSKIEAGMMRFERTPFSLDATLRHLGDLNAQKARERGLELLFDLGADVPDRLIGDPLRLGQVLLNLVGNAIKFTEQGEITVTVDLVERRERDLRLRFVVSDTGIGMNPEQVANLFTAFTQADSSTTRKYGGTGLGLSICKRIVDLLGGSIEATSEPGAGSRFTFELDFPVAEGDAEAPRRLGLPDRLRTLVVDDNTGAREVFAHMLATLGIDCRVAASGSEALVEIASAQRAGEDYGLLLVDWKMPVMDGVELLAAIRRETAQPPAIIMTTAHDHEELRDALGELPVNAILGKPATPSTLFDAIMVALHRAPAPVGASHQTTRPWFAGNRRVLLVEDNAVNRELAEEMLSATGLLVATAENGALAVDQVRNGNFDLVLMDCQMPVMDGYEATRQIRDELERFDLPIVAMTANALPADRDRCLAVGMNDHIAKPIDVGMLYATLQRWLGEAAATAPVPPTPEPRNERLNRTAALARVGGKADFYAKLLKRFATDQADLPARLDRALATGAGDELIRLAHTLRGLAGNIGAERLAALAGELEKAMREESTAAAIQPRIDRLAEEHRALLAQIAADGSDRAPPPAPGNPATPEALARLQLLLDNDDASAVRQFDTLADGLRQQTETATVDRLERLIYQYDFEDASALLREILAPLSPRPKTP